MPVVKITVRDGSRLRQLLIQSIHEYGWADYLWSRGDYANQGHPHSEKEGAYRAMLESLSDDELYSAHYRMRDIINEFSRKDSW